MDEVVKAGHLAEKYARRYRKALLGDGDAPRLPTAIELEDATSILSLISALAHAVGHEGSAESFAHLEAALSWRQPRLARPPTRALVKRLSAVRRIAEARESLRRILTWQQRYEDRITTHPPEWQETGLPPIDLDRDAIRRAAIRARRYERAFERWCHEDQRVRLGLEALGLAMAREATQVRGPTATMLSGSVEERVAQASLQARLGLLAGPLEGPLTAAWKVWVDLETLRSLAVENLDVAALRASIVRAVERMLGERQNFSA